MNSAMRSGAGTRLSLAVGMVWLFTAGYASANNPITQSRLRPSQRFAQFGTGRQEAAPTKPRYEVTCLVTVQTFRDAGGQEVSKPGETPVNAAFTQGLIKYLAEAVKGPIRVIGKNGSGSEGQDSKAKVNGGHQRFVIEGDLSRVESEAEGKKSYLCVMRLFREGKPRQLVAQWAGTAATFRDLSGNLRRDPRQNQEGLLGDMGKRVASCLQSVSGLEATQQLETLIERTPAKGKATVELVREDPSRPPTGPIDVGAQTGLPVQLITGQTFRLRVTLPRTGQVFLVGRKSDGRLKLLATGAESPVLLAGQPRLLPLDHPLTAEEATGLTEVTLTVLTRQADPIPNSERTPPAPKSPSPVGGASIQPGEDAAPAVAVLESRAADSDDALHRLLQTAAAAAPGLWTAQTVTFSLLPRSAKRQKDATP